jgi:hypothetical protein
MKYRRAQPKSQFASTIPTADFLFPIGASARIGAIAGAAKGGLEQEPDREIGLNERAYRVGLNTAAGTGLGVGAYYIPKGLEALDNLGNEPVANATPVDKIEYLDNQRGLGARIKKREQVASNRAKKLAEDFYWTAIEPVQAVAQKGARDVTGTVKAIGNVITSPFRAASAVKDATGNIINEVDENIPIKKAASKVGNVGRAGLRKALRYLFEYAEPIATFGLPDIPYEADRQVRNLGRAIGNNVLGLADTELPKGIKYRRGIFDSKVKIDRNSVLPKDYEAWQAGNQRSRILGYGTVGTGTVGAGALGKHILDSRAQEEVQPSEEEYYNYLRGLQTQEDNLAEQDNTDGYGLSGNRFDSY